MFNTWYKPHFFWKVMSCHFPPLSTLISHLIWHPPLLQDFPSMENFSLFIVCTHFLAQNHDVTSKRKKSSNGQPDLFSSDSKRLSVSKFQSCRGNCFGQVAAKRVWHWQAVCQAAFLRRRRKIHLSSLLLLLQSSFEQRSLLHATRRSQWCGGGGNYEGLPCCRARFWAGRPPPCCCCCMASEEEAAVGGGKGWFCFLQQRAAAGRSCCWECPGCCCCCCCPASSSLLHSCLAAAHPPVVLHARPRGKQASRDRVRRSGGLSNVSCDTLLWCQLLSSAVIWKADTQDTQTLRHSDSEGIIGQRILVGA